MKNNLTKNKAEQNIPDSLMMNSQIVKGAITFLVEEVNRLNILEIKQGLKQVFDYDINDDNLINYTEHLRDRNVLSVSIASEGKLYYKIRKLQQAELEYSQVKNIIGTIPILKKKFEQWKSKVSLCS
jgi:hypothetical protein